MSDPVRRSVNGRKRFVYKTFSCSRMPGRWCEPNRRIPAAHTDMLAASTWSRTFCMPPKQSAAITSRMMPDEEYQWPAGWHAQRPCLGDATARPGRKGHARHIARLARAQPPTSVWSVEAVGNSGAPIDAWWRAWHVSRMDVSAEKGSKEFFRSLVGMPGTWVSRSTPILGQQHAALRPHV
jgi:hypothetical protein